MGLGVAHTLTNPSTREAETQGLPQVQSYPGYITSTRAVRVTWEGRKRSLYRAEVNKSTSDLSPNYSQQPLKNRVVRKYSSNAKTSFLHQTTKE